MLFASPWDVKANGRIRPRFFLRISEREEEKAIFMTGWT